MAAQELNWITVILATPVCAFAAAYVACATVARRAQARADKDCDDFTAQKNGATLLQEAGPRDNPQRLDDGGDRIACEENPCRCSRKWHRQHGRVALSRQL